MSMIEYQRPGDASGRSVPRIKVVAVGGAGMSTLDRLALDGAPNAELVAVNTDMQNLAGSVVPAKIQIGADLTRGLGAGGDPEIGYTAAEEASEELAALLENTEMLFLCGGLGGGTGSGALPVLARMGRERGILVVSVVTLPFEFEGRRRLEQAAQALALIEAESDAVLCFENDRMGESVLPKAGIHQAFASADMTISQCIRSIIGLVTQQGLMEVGFDRLLTTVRRAASRSVFGYGEASGDNRCVDALQVALKNPLLDRGRMLEEANHLIVNVVGGNQLTLHEIETLMEEVCRHVHDRTQIFLGVTIDSQLGGRMNVMLLSSVGGEAPAREQRAAIAMPHTEAVSQSKEMSEAPTANVAPEAAGPSLFEDLDESVEVLGEKSSPAEASPAEASPAVAAPPPAPAKTVPQPGRREPLAAKKAVEKEAQAKQETLQFEPINRGRFEKSEPTIEDGQDLDVPAFLRKKVPLK